MKQHFHSASPYESAYGFSRAVRVGDRVLIAGTAPIPPEGQSVAATASLEAAGSGAADVVRTRMFLTDSADADEVGRAHAELFGDAAPAATMVVVAALINPAWRVELEVEAVLA